VNAGPLPGPGRRVGGRSLAPYLPLPLVAAAVLLAALIVLTPNLLSTAGPTAGSPETQAELLVDRGPSDINSTHLYLRGIGLVRFVSMGIAYAPLFGSFPPASLAGVRWSNLSEGTGVLGLTASVSVPSFALNASAVYVDPEGTGVLYTGLYAFAWSSGKLESIGYLGATGASPASLSALPLILLLPQAPYGGP